MLIASPLVHLIFDARKRIRLVFSYHQLSKAGIQHPDKRKIRLNEQVKTKLAPGWLTLEIIFSLRVDKMAL